MEDTMRMLPVKLTDGEYADRAAELAKTMEAQRAAEAEFELAKSAHKSRLSSLESEVSRLHEVVLNRSERRPVPVVTLKNHERGIVEVLRTDTHEVVESRPMTFDERQVGLFSDDGGRGDRADDAVRKTAEALRDVADEAAKDGITLAVGVGDEAPREIPPRKGRKAKAPTEAPEA